MAQIKIYGFRTSLEQQRRNLSKAIHLAVVEAFSYPPEKKFHRFIAMDDDDFIFQAPIRRWYPES